MNKAGLIIFAVLILSSGVFAKDVAYVLKNTNYPVPNFISSLNELNLSYDLIASNMVSITNFSKYNMILVGDESILSVPVNSYKTLFLSPTFYNGWSSFTGSTASNQPLIANNSDETSINKDFMGLFNVYTSCCDSQGISLPMYYLGGIKYGTSRVASTKNNLGEFVIATKNNPRREFFGITEADYWTSTTKQMFKNSILWILKGDDKDGDGYFSDSDCNDTNAAINPDGIEVPYNHIDENCDGYDIADIDNDGYCKLGYTIANKALQCNNETGLTGTDCNDNNESIYPGAFEAGDGIDTNCMAEAPIFTGNIDNVTWEENQIENIPSINLSDYFYDQDSRAISYFVNSSSPINNTHTIINGDFVAFSSDKYWSGEDWVIFGAMNSAGMKSYSNKMFMTIIPINNPPVLDNISEIYFIAGDLVNISISAFDPDAGETLNYSLSGELADRLSGENPWIWQTNLGDAGDYSVIINVNDGTFSDSKEIRIHLIPRIVINEFESNNGREWVELYNPGENDFNLSGWEIWDGLSSPKILIRLSETISGNGYLIAGVLGLNDGGEFITLYDSLNHSIDRTPTLADTHNDDRTWQRVPNGIDAGTLADWRFQKTTEGISNDADVQPPLVNSIYPLAHTTLVGNSMEFVYNASDEKALELNCSLYMYENTSYQIKASQNIASGIGSSFFLDNIRNNNYLWMIGCSDGINTGWSDIRTLIINAPMPPVINSIVNNGADEGENATIIVSAFDSNAEDNLTYSIDDSRFNISLDFANGHKFIWQTGYEDEGIYNISITVSDGVFDTTANITLTIRKTNRAPVAEDIENQIIMEDIPGSFQINASDPDNDALTYSIIMQNISEVRCTANSNIITMTPGENWNGQAYCTARVSDGDKHADKNISINVTPVNDAPWFLAMNNITINETQTAVIVINARDVENTELIYSTNDSNLIQEASSNIFRWQTNYSSAGVYFIEIKISDGELNASSTIKVTVNSINEPPHFLQLPDFQIYEDSGENVLLTNLSSYAYDNDGNITGFEVSGNTSEIGCRISRDSLMATPALDFATNNFTGLEDKTPGTCAISVIDDSEARTYVVININVSNVNDAPVIDLFSPVIRPVITAPEGKNLTINHVIIPEDGRQNFRIGYYDIDTNYSLLGVLWKLVDENSGEIIDRLENITNYDFTGNGNSMNLSLQAYVYDKFNSEDFEANGDYVWWNIVTSKIPLTSIFNGRATTNFSGMNDSQLASSNLVLERTGIGKIAFIDKADLRNIVDLDSYAIIEKNLAGIDSSVFTSLRNKNAVISIYNLNSDKVPTIYYSSRFTKNPDSITQICPSSICSNINYENGLLSFQASSFSVFKIGDARNCSVQRGFICGTGERCTSSLISAWDTDSCCSEACTPDFKSLKVCNKTDENIQIDITNPNDDESFNAGDTINGVLEISSSLDKSKSLDYAVSLYDSSNHDNIETVDGSARIDSSSKKISFKIKIPTDADENDNYYIYAKVKDGTNKSLCNENFIKININRNDNEVIVSNFEIDSETAVCGDSLELKADVKNIGSSDENVYLLFENEALGISEQSDSFTLESFGNNDEAERIMAVKIPGNASAGEYAIRASAVFSGNENSVEKSITLGDCIKESSTVQNIKTNSIQALGSNVLNKKSSAGFFSNPIVIGSIILLAVLLIVLLILIVRVGRNRNSADIQE